MCVCVIALQHYGQFPSCACLAYRQLPCYCYSSCNSSVNVQLFLGKLTRTVVFAGECLQANLTFIFICKCSGFPFTSIHIHFLPYVCLFIYSTLRGSSFSFLISFILSLLLIRIRIYIELEQINEYESLLFSP